MNEQITTLQNKLLEALDWKLMHESDPMIAQKGNSGPTLPSGDDLLLSSHLQGSASPWRTSINEENEFLKMQAIQNQSELDSLWKKLNSCVDEKEKLQRHIDDLVIQLEAERASKAAKTEEAPRMQIGLPSVANNQMHNAGPTDQIELKTMVDAIAAASQREAEAHETAIVLSKENDELKMKLKVLIEDNNKLIELYEAAVADNHTDTKEIVICKEQAREEEKAHCSQFAGEHLKIEKEVDNLKHQLLEMHEENDKLMGLYEKAMQERDEFKRLLVSTEQKIVESSGDFNFPEKLVEIDIGNNLRSDESFLHVDKKVTANDADSFETVIEDEKLPKLEDYMVSDDGKSLLVETGLYEVNVQDGYRECSVSKEESDRHDEDFPCSLIADLEENEFSGQTPKKAVETIMLNDFEASRGDQLWKGAGSSELSAAFFQEDSLDHDTSHGDQCACCSLKVDAKSSDVAVRRLSKDISSFRKKLIEAQEKISNSAQLMSMFGSLERAIIQVDGVSQEIGRLENDQRLKQQEYESSKVLYSEIHEKRALLDRKLAALRYSLSSISSSIDYFDQRETQARQKLTASSTCLSQKKEELLRLQACKEEILDAQIKTKQSEVEMKNYLADLKSKVEEETRRLENDRVLFAIENVEKTDCFHAQRDWHLTGKATELLKSEEEKTKLQNQMKQTREKLGLMRKEVEDMNKKLGKLEIDIEVVSKEIENSLLSVEEMGHKLQSIIKEKEMVLEMKENGRNEFESMIIEYHQYIFETELKEEEMRILDEELHSDLRKIEELQRAKAIIMGRKSQLFEAISSHSCLVSDKIEEDLHNIRMSIMELSSLLSDC